MKTEFNNKDLKNPDHYKWGIFYLNRDDSRLFVPKQQWGLGYTLNLGHRWAYMIILLFIGIIILISYLS